MNWTYNQLNVVHVPIDDCKCYLQGDWKEPCGRPHEGIGIQYDYDNQAWVIGGIYQDCTHPLVLATGEPCFCYGRTHKGEQASAPYDQVLCIH